MKNRDIEENEINKITALCPIREKAFFTIMRQSGLPPHTIKQLKIKHVEKILEPDTPTPCKIKKGRLRSIPDFIGVEAVKYLKQYLRTRTNLTPESLLFTIRNNPNKEINTKDVSRTFRLAAQKFENQRKTTFEVRKGEPSELRLYSLIKFYRKNAKDYLTELDHDHSPKDDEFYRKLYEEKAMPSLEIEPPTQIEIHQLKKEIERQNNEIKNLKFQLEIDAQVEWQREINEMTKPPEEARKNRLLTPEAYKIIRIEAPKSNKPYTQRLSELHLKLLEETLQNIKKSNIENKELHIEDLERQIEIRKFGLGQYPKTEKVKKNAIKFLKKEITTKDFQNIIKQTKETKKY
jgi:hypothetical protein